ncbi:Metalloenzyme superfamily protein [Histomonas meleagridis]|uniref:Metalloenzyme superfamily protein n=1 Tax=Histomonas meleagridis TaxID=135588 RepID=UPI003559EE29|nr:Metalloenzyme superfamily protein [Histomonas meleagridis]
MQQQQRKPAKILLIILDGLGDTTQEIEGRQGTCLELSRHPTFDSFTRTGLVGLMDSGTLHLNPIFLLCMEMIVRYRRCDRHFEVEGPILCQYLDGVKIPEFPEVQVSIAYATEHRCAVRIRAPNMSDHITGTDPIHDNLPLLRSEPLDDDPKSFYTSNIVNKLSDVLREKLNSHEINKKRIEEGKEPANVILLRGPGMRMNVETFEKRHQVRTFLIAPTAIIAGLGISVGLPIVKVDGATGDMDSNYKAKSKSASDHIISEEYDMGIVHIKGTDDAAHDGKPNKKVELIERADEAIGELIKTLSAYEVEHDERFIIGVVADHTTSSKWLDHTFEPIPVCFTEISKAAEALGYQHKRNETPYIPSDHIESYNEITAARGSLGRFCGSKLMELLLKLSGRK